MPSPPWVSKLRTWDSPRAPGTRRAALPKNEESITFAIAASPHRQTSFGAVCLLLSPFVQDRFSTGSLHLLRAIRGPVFAGKLDAGECGLHRAIYIKSIWACELAG